MVLTVEEKLNKLKEYEGWLDFTDQQRDFLVAMAESDNNLFASYKKAYPHVKAASVSFSVHGMIQTLSIKSCLELLGYRKEKKEIVSKKEAMELLSQHLRRTSVEPDMLVKLLAMYSKLAGWEEDKGKNPDEGMSLDKLVTALEKKRKAEVQP